MSSHGVYMIPDTDFRLAGQNIEDTAVAHINRVSVRFVMYDFSKTDEWRYIRKQHSCSSKSGYIYSSDLLL